MLPERIKNLREQNNWTQSELAKKLGITRSSVNAWEMGISVPSTQYICELANLFRTSTDFVLSMGNNEMLDISGLTSKDIQLVYALIQHLREHNNIQT